MENDPNQSKQDPAAPVIHQKALQNKDEEIINMIGQYFKQENNQNNKQGNNQTQIYDLTELLRFSLSNQKKNRALGCLFGCLIGDALGAYCQFKSSISKQILTNAMKMPGGGTFNLRAGQYTDDSQLAYHLLSALSSFNPSKSLQDQHWQLICMIANEYLNWQASGPFDIGNTCSNGLYCLRQHKQQFNIILNKSKESPQNQSAEIWRPIFSDIMHSNSYSQSNGSLMRIAPMALFLSILEENPIEHSIFIKNEIQLMHPNVVLQQAGVSWVTLLTKLINRTENSPKEFRQIYQDLNNSKDYNLLKTWFAQAGRSKQDAMKAVQNMGWAKIAWSYGFRIIQTLREKTEEELLGKTQQEKKQIKITQLGSQFYRDEIKWVISRAGDTDTNAAIVGGLIGAIIGFKKLPIQYLSIIFKLKFDKPEDQKYTDRDRRYQPLNVLKMVLKLFKKSETYHKSSQKQE